MKTNFLKKYKIFFIAAIIIAAIIVLWSFFKNIFLGLKKALESLGGLGNTLGSAIGGVTDVITTAVETILPDNPTQLSSNATYNSSKNNPCVIPNNYPSFIDNINFNASVATTLLQKATQIYVSQDELLAFINYCGSKQTLARYSSLLNIDIGNKIATNDISMTYGFYNANKPALAYLLQNIVIYFPYYCNSLNTKDLFFFYENVKKLPNKL